MNSTLNSMLQAATSTPFVTSTIGHHPWDHDMDEICSPYGPNVTNACTYVLEYNDACEGGGYLTWTAWVVCEASPTIRIVLIALAVFYMLYLLLFLGSATDDCLCTSISAIVDQLKISQNVAGVTFMAFGNGAADIFGNARRAIVFHKPFKVMRRPIIRDFVFFLVALIMLLLILLYDDKMYYWQPLVLLGLYVIYAMTVVFGSSIRMGKFLCFQWETKWIQKQRQKQRQIQDHSTGKPKMIFTDQEKAPLKGRLLRYFQRAHAWEFYGLGEAPCGKDYIGGRRPWIVGLLVGSLRLFVALPLAIFTKRTEEPKYLKYILPYVGFLVAVSWVYALAAEIVNVVMMFGVVSRVSHVILGLTLLAWSNCIGDLIADLAVAKQGFPRMAISAAVGGPLLNLLIGFGLSFLVAILQGKTIVIPRGEFNKIVMIFFLCLSLISSLAILTVQRFQATRFYAYFLLGLYAIFIVTALVIETGLINV
ncbi:CBN-NCX-6 protein [Aphelenchoides fujianensis]|nr:CBN-NCX-6 protein [Aphelenchoides fujianensis]